MNMNMKLVEEENQGRVEGESEFRMMICDTRREANTESHRKKRRLQKTQA